MTPGYLIDTNVLSEVRRTRPRPGVVSWLRSTPAQRNYLSVLTLGEVRKGIERIRLADPDRAVRLEGWLTGLYDEFADRLLAVDDAVAESWGRICAGLTPPTVDSLIAATAAVHGLTVATRNTRDFERMGVETHNPFDD